MFFNGIYRLQIWNDIDSKSRNVRLLILGAVVYIIIHSFINSKYVDHVDLITNNKFYLYYVMAIDLAFVGIMMLFESDKPNKKKKKKKNSKMHKRWQQIQLQQMQLQKWREMQQRLINQNYNNNKVNNNNNNDDNASVQIPIYENNHSHELEHNNNDIPLYQNNTTNDNDSIPIYPSNLN